MGAPSDIDRLIELGLNRYGAGDLEGALLMWEEALAIDPDNARASSYADYVRLHYEMLNGGEPEIVPGDEAPFGIEEDPEYQIEIEPGELDPGTLRDAHTPVVTDSLDLGWFDEEATHDVSSVVDRSAEPKDPEEPEEPEIELTLEAEEPAPPPAAEVQAGTSDALPEVSFEDATREYHGNPTKPALPVGDLAPAVPITHLEFESEAGTGGDFSENAGTSEFKQEYTGGFQSEGTPIGFGNQETEIRKRDFGFVQPTAPTPAAAPTPVRDKPSSPLNIGSAPTIDTLQLGELTQERLTAPEGTSPGEKTLERRPSFEHALNEPDEHDLLEGLPVPNRPAKPEPAVETQGTPFAGSKGITKELPDSKRPPARRDSADLSQAEVMMNAAATRDFSQKIDIAAPTRELGIRPPIKRPPTLENPDDDDMPTKQSDARAIRDTAREQGRAEPRAASEPTHHDLVVPIDPVDARTAQILDEVDAEAPAGESASDQTRRRITLLLERAVAWNQAGDAEKAVCAVDLALDEDPNSAIAQKLITRHRDAIMNVMQSYLGDLDRQPQLAKSLQDLQNAPISPRAAFLVSRIDGTLTLDELLDVSGMPRLEALRHLCQLHLRGVLR